MTASHPSSLAPLSSSPWWVVGVPAFSDNYLWVIHNGHDAIVVDPGDAAPIQGMLNSLGLRLTAILCTHHHGDHVGGVQALIQTHHENGYRTSIPVYGPQNENIPGRTVPVEEGDRLSLAAGEFRVIAVPGHTAGHVAYIWQDRLFCGDTLFALGCGRLFEGTPAQMLDSLHRLAVLPGEWYVHCAHEYTLSNLAFALAVDANNPDLIARGERERARRAQGLPTVPSRMSEERATNPFLRAQHPAIQASAASWARKRLNSELEVWTALREWKNQFKV